jgi:sigma-E factor negative regulatory protein RseB
MRRRVVTGIAGVLTAGLLLFVAPGGAHADDDSDAARRLLQESRDAATAHDFTGTVEVEWRDGRTLRHETVAVEVEDGVLHLGKDRLLGAGNRRVLKTDSGWELLWAAPAQGGEPDPGAKYDLSVGARASVATRPATIVAIRRSGSERVRERLYVDDDTGMLLRRDQLDGRGRLVRSFAFVKLSPPAAAAPGADEKLPKVARSKRDDAPDALDGAPDAFTAPRRIGRGFVLAGVYSQSDGAVQLYYSDGLLGLSVFEREGELDWDALPSGGRKVDLAGRRARVYTTVVGMAAVWTSDGITYTAVTDAPADEVAAIVEDMDAADEPSTMEGIGRFVTRPFSWG